MASSSAGISFSLQFKQRLNRSTASFSKEKRSTISLNCESAVVPRTNVPSLQTSTRFPRIVYPDDPRYSPFHMSRPESSDNESVEIPKGEPSSSEQSPLVTILHEAASRVLQRRFRLFLLVRRAYSRMVTHSDVLSAVWDDLRTMLRLVLQWATRSYRRVTWAPLILIVGALLYFVTPVDAIPDAIGALGFVDDVTVITTVVRKIRDELDRFRTWEETRSLSE